MHFPIRRSRWCKIGFILYEASVHFNTLLLLLSRKLISQHLISSHLGLHCAYVTRCNRGATCYAIVSFTRFESNRLKFSVFVHLGRNQYICQHFWCALGSLFCFIAQFLLFLYIIQLRFAMAKVAHIVCCLYLAGSLAGAGTWNEDFTAYTFLPLSPLQEVRLTSDYTNGSSNSSRHIVLQVAPLAYFIILRRFRKPLIFSCGRAHVCCSTGCHLCSPCRCWSYRSRLLESRKNAVSTFWWITDVSVLTKPWVNQE